MARTPHGYHDRAAIEQDLRGAGFTTAAQITTIAARSTAPSARHAAIAYCQGTPLRSEIEARDRVRLGEATDFAAAAIEQRFGAGLVDAKMQAHIIVVER